MYNTKLISNTNILGNRHVIVPYIIHLRIVRHAIGDLH